MSKTRARVTQMPKQVGATSPAAKPHYKRMHSTKARAQAQSKSYHPPAKPVTQSAPAQRAPLENLTETAQYWGHKLTLLPIEQTQLLI